MKFQQLSAFEKHLDKAAPNHLARVYLVAAACAYERRQLFEQIKGAIGKREKETLSLFFNASQVDWARVREELDTASFLGGCRVILFDEVDLLKKDVLVSLGSYVAHPSPFVYLVLGASATKALSTLYEGGKKELIVCDLCAEKPWERKERLKTHLVAKAAHEGKRFTPPALEMMIQRVGNELPVLEQELKKLLLYALERSEITERDIEAISLPEKGLSIRVCAEAICWQERLPALDASFDLSSFFYLLKEVRTQLQQGLQLSLHLAAGSYTAPSPVLFKPQMIEKITPLVRRRTASYFQAKLSLVFEMELLAKSATLPPRLLFDLLAAKMKQ
jgi:hypothetical protein